MGQSDPKPKAQPSLPGVFDHEAALRRLGNDTSLFQEMVGFFFSDSPGLLAQIRDGLARGDAKQVERAAHSLKGMASMFDAGRAVAAAAAVEQFGRARQLDQAATAADGLRREVEHLTQAMAPHRPK